MRHRTIESWIDAESRRRAAALSRKRRLTSYDFRDAIARAMTDAIRASFKIAAEQLLQPLPASLLARIESGEDTSSFTEDCKRPSDRRQP